jgi:hypothetical protein
MLEPIISTARQAGIEIWYDGQCLPPKVLDALRPEQLKG